MQTRDRQLISSQPLEQNLTARTASVKRTTGETDVQVTPQLDGQGHCVADTGVPFFRPYAASAASHGLIDLEVQATGDLQIDDHHTNEDVGITLGQALGKHWARAKVLSALVLSSPLDEALIQVALELSGRPHLSYGLQIPTQRVGTYDTQLVEFCCRGEP